MAPPAIEKDFAVEDIWADWPMGYHINPTMGPGNSMDVWESLERRKAIYDYCPEIKIILDMHLERERCPVHPTDPGGVDQNQVLVEIAEDLPAPDVVDPSSTPAEDPMDRPVPEAVEAEPQPPTIVEDPLAEDVKDS